MRFFRRKAEREQQTCPRCSQILEPAALECPVCGLDLREARPAPAAAVRPVPPGPGTG
jgi:uncharacterized paraquat-inducible protein A